MACFSGYCIPQRRPELLSSCTAGTDRVAIGQAGQPAPAPVAQTGRRLLVAVGVTLEGLGRLHCGHDPLQIWPACGSTPNLFLKRSKHCCSDVSAPTTHQASYQYLNCRISYALNR